MTRRGSGEDTAPVRPAPGPRVRLATFFELLWRHDPGHAMLRAAWRLWRPWNARLLHARRAGRRPVSARPAGSALLPGRDPAGARVRIIVPTRARGGLVAACVRSIERTCPRDLYRLVIVDTGVRSPRAREQLRRIARPHRLVRWRLPFHFARVNNWAAQQGDEPLLLFLNDDTEALEPGWLERMVRTTLQPGVGIAGAVLLYGDGTLQHAGIGIGLDPPTFHRDLGRREGQWRASLRGPEPFDVSAVTGAALMCRREVFSALGGFCPRFSLFYNDVDLCLRARARLGVRCVLDPGVRLLHHESRSRGRYHRLEEESLFLRRWAARWPLESEEGARR